MGKFGSKLGIFQNRWSILTKSLEILKNLFRFSYIESFVILGNLFPFFNLKCKYFLRIFYFPHFCVQFQSVGRKFGSIREKRYLFRQE